MRKRLQNRRRYQAGGWSELLPSSMQEGINQFTNTLEQGKQDYINTNMPTAPVLGQSNLPKSNNGNPFNGFNNNAPTSTNSMFGFNPGPQVSGFTGGFNQQVGLMDEVKYGIEKIKYEKEKAQYFMGLI